MFVLHDLDIYWYHFLKYLFVDVLVDNIRNFCWRILSRMGWLCVAIRVFKNWIYRRRHVVCLLFWYFPSSWLQIHERRCSFQNIDTVSVKYLLVNVLSILYQNSLSSWYERKWRKSGLLAAAAWIARITRWQKLEWMRYMPISSKSYQYSSVMIKHT